YGAVALITTMGFWLRKGRTVAATAGFALGGSVLFFVLTNFGVWLSGAMYPMTPSGLMACYVAAIPFFHNTLIATALYSALLFSGEWLFRSLQQRHA
ncbi:MAG: hypothetical protein OIF34_01315, partial [Porticoccaceae bacterium]|nr:hypothetical protein [Porticoccaceae bacterium]